MFEKIVTFVKANQDAIIKKGLVVVGALAGAVLVTLAERTNAEPSEVVMSDVVDEETGEVSQVTSVAE